MSGPCMLPSSGARHPSTGRRDEIEVTAQMVEAGQVRLLALGDQTSSAYLHARTWLGSGRLQEVVSIRVQRSKPTDTLPISTPLKQRCANWAKWKAWGLP